jgi:hypothetical protein
MYFRTRLDSGAGQTTHITHRIDGTGTMIQQTTEKNGTAYSLRGLRFIEQLDRRAQALPFFCTPGQILIAAGRVRRMDGTGAGGLALHLMPFDQRKDISGGITQQADQGSTAAFAESRAHILRRQSETGID